MLGLEDKILNSLKICILSALIISPSNFFAKLTANFDFPDAVGPAKRIIFFDKLIYFDTKVSSSILFIYYC